MAPHNCTLADLHGTHQGIDKMQAQARGAVYWPSIDANIAGYVCQCTICNKHEASPPAQHMLPWDIPDGLWQKITADYITHKGKAYLLAGDLFSKYPFLFKVSSKSAKSMFKYLLKLISQYGLPCLLYTNNSPLFASDELAKFLQHNHTDHITSSPQFPRSNSFIECKKQTIKTMLSTSQESHKSLEELLLDLCSTLIGPNMPSPWGILHNRTLQHPSKPSTPFDMESVWNFLISKRQPQKTNYDRAHGVRELHELQPSQEVLFLFPTENEYIPGTITDKATAPHSYYIEAQGKCYHRMREHTRPSISTFPCLKPNPHPKHQSLVISQNPSLPLKQFPNLKCQLSHPYTFISAPQPYVQNPTHLPAYAPTKC